MAFRLDFIALFEVVSKMKELIVFGAPPGFTHIHDNHLRRNNFQIQDEYSCFST